MFEDNWEIEYDGEYETEEFPEWFINTFDDMIMDGLIEVVAMNPDGTWLYNVSQKGKEWLEKSKKDDTL